MHDSNLEYFMTQTLKIVMGQLNFLVGDIDGNTEIVIQSSSDSIDEHAADMIVFPELTLTGYPMEDLLLRPSLEHRIDKAIDRILNANLDITIVLGYPRVFDSKLYNTLGVIHGGELLGEYHKQCLPNYQVFDERRYFEPGQEACVIKIKNILCAFTVCEDLWQEGPVRDSKLLGAQMLVNINASPFHINKSKERQDLLVRRCNEGNFPIVYVNLVGGQDELVFDGGSMVVDAKGQNCYQAPSFKEGLYPFTLGITSGGMVELCSQLIASNISVEESVYQSLMLGVRDYVRKNKFAGVVLGLSGGIDSALTLAIAVDALGAENVQAVMMPFEYTSKLSLDAAAKQARRLNVKYKVIPINKIYRAFESALKEEFEDTVPDVSEQNLQARSRGVILMGISNKKGLLVLTTGNKSEIAVGYSTLYGDMAGGFNVLKDVSKTLVYELARYRNALEASKVEDVIPQEVIDRAPSAELLPGQSDEDSLPPYAILDEILELYVEKDLSADAIILQGFDKKVVQHVVKLVDRNEYKRRQSPVGIRLTERGFGRDRRYPITNAWKIGG